MEMANLAGLEQYADGVRVAEADDARAITRLLRMVPYSHVHVDWRLPVDWLGSPGFVVLPEPSLGSSRAKSVSEKLLGPTPPRLQACLAVAADPPPAAWVRVASIASVARPDLVLAAMLQAVTDFLRETAVTQLGWLSVASWPDPWLPELGFVQTNAIETYVKEGITLPGEMAVPDLQIRPAAPADMEALARIEAAAFDPLWRHSAETLELARQQAFSFDVAERNGLVLGFQVSAYGNGGAHLVRLTVDPALQRQGIGSALLSRAFAVYRQHGLQRVTLNTQVDNYPSQHLYRKFGFVASGQQFPVWSLSLSD